MSSAASLSRRPSTEGPSLAQQKNAQLTSICTEIHEVLGALKESPYGHYFSPNLIGSVEGRSKLGNKAMLQALKRVKELVDSIDLAQPSRAGSMEMSCEQCKKSVVASQDLSVDTRVAHIFCSQCKELAKQA